MSCVRMNVVSTFLKRYFNAAWKYFYAVLFFFFEGSLRKTTLLLEMQTVVV